MHRALYVLSALALLMAVYVLAFASPFITQQTAGLLILLIAAVLFAGGAIVQAVLFLVPSEKLLSPEELRDKQVRDLAESWNAPVPTPAAES